MKRLRFLSMHWMNWKNQMPNNNLRVLHNKWVPLFTCSSLSKHLLIGLHTLNLKHKGITLCFMMITQTTTLLITDVCLCWGKRKRTLVNKGINICIVMYLRTINGINKTKLNMNGLCISLPLCTHILNSVDFHLFAHKQKPRSIYFVVFLYYWLMCVFRSSTRSPTTSIRTVLRSHNMLPDAAGFGFICCPTNGAVSTVMV